MRNPYFRLDLPKKIQEWFKTDLDFSATKKMLLKAAYKDKIVGDMQDYRGRLSFSLKEYNSITFQVTSNGKLGIYYPKEITIQKCLKLVKPFLFRVDLTPAKVFTKIGRRTDIQHESKTVPRKKFRSESQRRRALKHSKLLFFPEEYMASSRIGQLVRVPTDFIENLDEFVYNQKKYVNQLSHIETGYKEIWSLIQKYLLLMKKYGLDKIPGCPKISSIKHLSTEWQEDVMPEKYPKAEEGYVSITNFTDLDSKIMEPIKDYCAKHGIPVQMPEEIVEELKEMQKLIIGQIRSQILEKIEHGIPIRGSCNLCPNREGNY